jgi:hypothetical protein
VEKLFVSSSLWTKATGICSVARCERASASVAQSCADSLAVLALFSLQQQAGSINKLCCNSVNVQLTGGGHQQGFFIVLSRYYYPLVLVPVLVYLGNVSC